MCDAVLICNRAGFCSIRKISGRVMSSRGLDFGETVGRTKTPMTRKPAQLHAYHPRLNKLHSCVNAPHAPFFPRLGECTSSNDKFWREFVMSACVASFYPLLEPVYMTTRVGSPARVYHFPVKRF